MIRGERRATDKRNGIIKEEKAKETNHVPLAKAE
jgi:hypothetical protein